MRSQRGAVLVVSLIFLLIITAIAVASLSGSTLQTVMARNAQLREAIFRATESAIEQAIEFPNVFDRALATAAGFAVPGVTTSVDDSEADARVSCLQARPIVGYQIGGGTSYAVFVFDATATANTTDDRVASRITQGVAIGMPDNREPGTKVNGC